MIDPPPRTMSVRAAAQALGVHENTIRNWLRSGTLPGVKLPSGVHRPIAADVLARVRARADQVTGELHSYADELDDVADELHTRSRHVHHAADTLRTSNVDPERPTP
jgi:excisionase family DNA binding protein